MKGDDINGVGVDKNIKAVLVRRSEVLTGSSTNIEILREEKDYQKQMNEKLNSASDWYKRDTKSFSFG